MNPWLGQPSVPQSGVALPRQPRFSSLTSTAASPLERWLTLNFVNYNQTPQCPFPAEPVQADDLNPPCSLHFVGGGDFKAIGRSFFEHFVGVCQLKPDSTVLDIGCGTGRMAIPLLDYLNESGSYCGFDISQKAITWCRKHITSKNSRFLFTYADVINKEYNPKGKIHASEYIFPCANESIDFAFATSVFTHMRATEVRQYLSEIRRTLKPQGKAMLTFYILDELALGLMQNGKASMSFNVKLQNCFTIDDQTPEAVVCELLAGIASLLAVNPTRSPILLMDNLSSCRQLDIIGCLPKKIIRCH